MNPDGGSTDPEFFPASASNPINIFIPPDATSAGLGEVTIQSGCKISASGAIDTLNFPGLSFKLQRIWARVIGAEGSASDIEGIVAGNNWSVNNIPGARWSAAGLIQTVTVHGQFYMNPPITNAKQFIARRGDSSCQYYSFETAVGSLPIQEAIPRYFRVSAEFGEQQGFGLLAGGLLSLGKLILAYDVTTSTPECAVWRDIGLPPSVGSWLLRVVRTGCETYEARLSMQSATDTCVMPATFLWTRNWSFRHRNHLHGTFDIGTAKTDVTLIVEPA